MILAALQLQFSKAMNRGKVLSLAYNANSYSGRMINDLGTIPGLSEIL